MTSAEAVGFSLAREIGSSTGRGSLACRGDGERFAGRASRARARTSERAAPPERLPRARRPARRPESRGSIAHAPARRPVVAHVDARRSFHASCLADLFSLRVRSTSRRDRVRFTRTQLALPALALPTAWRAYGAGYLDKSEVTDRVVSVVKNFNKVDPAKVGPNASFGADLGLDSLDTVEVVMAMEEEFAVEIPDAEADKITSVAEAVEYLAANPDAK